jgi:protein SCO1/2
MSRKDLAKTMPQPKYVVPALLWSIVALAGCWIAYTKLSAPSIEVTPEAPKGMVLVDVPWEHLPHIDRFQLIDQNGDEFDSAQLDGHAYVVSFFFATCPDFCMELNKELERTSKAVKSVDVRFLTVSVDPEKDTPEKLGDYAAGFGAKVDRWAFLTGDKYRIVELGEHNFNVIVDPAHHTDNILLVDKWGRYRDRFKWDQPYDMKRFVSVVKEVAAETQPPMGELITTRNAMAGINPDDINNIRWVREFHLTERSGDPFFSRDLTGEVWIGNFFFSLCPGICQKQNEYLRDLQIRLGDKSPRLVSITTDSINDTPEKLRAYADTFNADSKQWLFLTGSGALIKRIGSEFFHAMASGGHHSSLLFVVDRWGRVRGSFDWQNKEEEKAMLKLVEALKLEKVPTTPKDLPKPEFDLGEDDEETSTTKGDDE